MKLTLGRIRTSSYGGKLRHHSYHPRSWEKKDTPGNNFHTLYFSDIILKQINKRRGRRQKVPKREWNSDKKEWRYKYRHAKESVPNTSNLSNFITESFYPAEQGVQREIKPTKLNFKSIFMSPFYYSDSIDFPTGADRIYRRGGKAHGRTYKIRREIFELFRKNDDFLCSTIITPEDLKRDRGKLRKVTILMPDFSLAIKELLFREVINDNGEKSLEGLLLQFKHKPNPKSILSIFPKRGPGSGESRHLITKFLNSKNPKFDDFNDKLQDLINITWRSVMANLVEMHHLNKNDQQVWPKPHIIHETDMCEDDDCDSSEIFSRTDGIRFCEVCGLVQSVFDDIDEPLTVRCIAHVELKDKTKMRCLARTTNPSRLCTTHNPKKSKVSQQYYE
jgi:hypothetical protein